MAKGRVDCIEGSLLPQKLWVGEANSDGRVETGCAIMTCDSSTIRDALLLGTTCSGSPEESGASLDFKASVATICYFKC